MKKLLKKLHLYLALAFFLPLILQGLTGALLVFQEKISNYNYKLSEGKPHSLQEIVDSAHENSPPIFIKFNEEGFAKIRFSKTSEVIVDPVSLEIVAQKNPEEGFFYWVKKIHTNLMLEKPYSRTIIGCFGIALLFLSISGIILWWPKNLEKFRKTIVFKFSDQGYRFQKTLHKTIGFWFFIIITSSSISGIYLAFKSSPTPVKVAEKTGKYLKINEAENLARSAVEDDSQLLAISFPAKTDQPYRFNFVTKSLPQGAPLISVFIDPYEGKVVEIRNPNSAKMMDRILAWQHSIHTGEAFGIVWKILVFLTGFTPIIFSISGIIMWRMKKKK